MAKKKKEPKVVEDYQVELDSYGQALAERRARQFGEPNMINTVVETPEEATDSVEVTGG